MSGWLDKKGFLNFWSKRMCILNGNILYVFFLTTGQYIKMIHVPNPKK